ncbi:MAG: hypothetical protein JW776_05280 [Candidatus Lokiarchaeota archaeon]|nr:hypothetical protein [Candidatus Lokiarchaeota archaeon]
MPKKRKSAKQEDYEEEIIPEKISTQPKTEMQNLIKALETKDSIPKLKSSIPEWTTDVQDKNIVDSPSFLDGDVTPSIITKLIPEKNKLISQAPRKEYSSTGTLFGDIGVFITELTDSYAQRYDTWEESTNSVLAVLRKLQIVSSDNTEQLVNNIETFHEQIKVGLDRFQIKREYVEKYADTNHTETARMLKKTLDLLALQIKEFKLKNLLNQLIAIYVK